VACHRIESPPSPAHQFGELNHQGAGSGGRCCFENGPRGAQCMAPRCLTAVSNPPLLDLSWLQQLLPGSTVRATTARPGQPAWVAPESPPAGLAVNARAVALIQLLFVVR